METKVVDVSQSIPEQIAAAFQALENNLSQPSSALSSFEPILLALYLQYDPSTVRMISLGGIALQEQLEKQQTNISTEVETFLDLLSELSPYPNGSQYSRSITELLQYVREVLGVPSS